MQEWEAGRCSKAWIPVDIILHHLPDLISDDFSNYRRNGLDRPLDLSGIAVFVEKRKIVSIYIIDLSKSGEVVRVQPRVFHKFIDHYVQSFVADHNHFIAKMKELRGDRLLGGRSGYSLSEAVFDINQETRNARNLLVARVERIKELLPSPNLPSPKRKEKEEASLQPSPTVPPVHNDGPSRRSGGASDLHDGLLPLSSNHARNAGYNQSCKNHDGSF